MDRHASNALQDIFYKQINVYQIYLVTLNVNSVFLEPIKMKVSVKAVKTIVHHAKMELNVILLLKDTIKKKEIVFRAQHSAKFVMMNFRVKFVPLAFYYKLWIKVTAL